MVEKDQFTGCFLGLALGDALGAPFEGGPIERLLWLLIGRTRGGQRRYTDDTQMSLDVAESLCICNGIDQDDLAATFAANYRWSRGYGAGAAKVLKRIRKGAHWHEVNCLIYPDGSYGNGAAMRAPIAALFFHGDDTEILHAVVKISEITHAHPLAIEGAGLIALATSYALSRITPDELFKRVRVHSKLEKFQIRIETARQWIATGKSPEPTTVVLELGNGIAAVDSCVTALYIAVRHFDSPFSDMLRFIQKCSGDTDTIGAMSGAVWGAYNGSNGLKCSGRERLESASRIEQLALKLYGRSTGKVSMKCSSSHHG